MYTHMHVKMCKVSSGDLCLHVKDLPLSKKEEDCYDQEGDGNGTANVRGNHESIRLLRANILYMHVHACIMYAHACICGSHR